MSPAEARGDAVRLLARREHSAQELRRKLGEKGHAAEEIAAALEALAREGLQSDHRFAESLIAARISGGYGPYRIRQELREKGVEDEVIEQELGADPRDWVLLAEDARCKRFGSVRPTELRERARQARFLQYRGFGADEIRRVLDGLELD